MAKRMLIDATHSEETRVVIIDGTRIEDFEVETSTKKQKKGNIYLGRITRVEPSLQAAFVDYGDDRHGFLAFSEIHPDYYQISEEDKQNLLAETRKAKLLEEERKAEEKRAEEERKAALREENGEENGEENSDENPAEIIDDKDDDLIDTPEIEDVTNEDLEDDYIEEEEDDALSPKLLARSFKIQDVIKRKQIVLVQVTKEERGNKGAALTTYLSLAGRYCVLMPNNFRGGGVSRKITNISDRHKLKDIIKDITKDNDMPVIVRTAGSGRNKSELKRDYDYLARVWEKIRSTSLKTTSPILVHEEANLIKRSIRDTNLRDIDEILVEGEEGYRVAKDFIKMLSPSNAKLVQPYKNDDSKVSMLFHYQVEKQLETLHDTNVPLKSGGYLVMNQTEALVAIDVNSGKATHERNIEKTAVHTNLEAADEIARQLKLRDMAGLVVIDFIDMDEHKHNREVEQRMKAALKKDRARIQMGKISGFGLMELSRQRLHSSFIESNYQLCPYCKGKGVIRSVESTAMYILRALEEESIKKTYAEISITVMPTIAFYILNNKRKALADMESTHKVNIIINSNDAFMVMTDFRIETTKTGKHIENSHEEDISAKNRKKNKRKNKHQKKTRNDFQETEAKEENSKTEIEEVSEEQKEEETKQKKEKPRKRRGTRGGRNRKSNRHPYNKRYNKNNSEHNSDKENSVSEQKNDKRKNKEETSDSKHDTKEKEAVNKNDTEHETSHKDFSDKKRNSSYKKEDHIKNFDENDDEKVISRFDKIKNKMLGTANDDIESPANKEEEEKKSVPAKKGWWLYS